MVKNWSISSSVVRWLRLMRQLDRAFFRSRLTANTALDGSPSEEQADFTDTHTPRPDRACWNRLPRTPATLRLRMWGTAPAGLLMRTWGYCFRPSSSRRRRAATRAARSSRSPKARCRASSAAAARARVGVPLR